MINNQQNIPKLYKGLINKLILTIGVKRMDSFKEFLSEENKLGRLSIFDIDDTLFHTTAKITVMKDGKVLKKLSNQEFNTYVNILF